MIMLAPPLRPDRDLLSKVILWPEDDPSIATILRVGFTDHGFRNLFVSTTHLGSLCLVSRLNPDIILTDMEKPRYGRSGELLARYVRQSPAFAQTPLVLCSGYTLIEPAWEELFDIVFPKPFDVRDAIAMIRRVFETNGRP